MMSYPPGGYGNPPPNAGYPPQHQSYGQHPGYTQPPYQQPGPGSSIGFDGLNQPQQPSSGMPMPGGPGYGGTPYPQQPNPYPQPGGAPQQNPYGGSFSSMAYAASAAVNFRQQYSQQPAPMQPSYGNPPQSQYGNQPQPQYGNPPQPQYGNPPQPQYGNPPQPQYGNQSHAAQTQPSYGNAQQAYQQPQRTALPTPSGSQTASVPKEPATQGTVRDHSPFNAQQDAELLRKAMKGFGTDEKAVIHIVGTRSNAQRQKIKLEFATMFGKDLIKELKSELSGNFETAVLALMMPVEEYDAYQLYTAMKGLGTDEKVLVEILCSRTNKQIKAASDAFKRMYKSDLEKELRSETSGHFRRLLVSLVQGSRLENEPLNQQKAAEEARALYDAGEAKWGTDESRFNAIFASRSAPQLRLTFEEYRKISKRSIEQAVTSEMSGDLKNGMLAIVKCAKDRPSYFAEQLYYSVKGLGTDDKTLVRIMVSRSEIDMVQIKNAFKNMYGKTLASFISDDCSGDYKKILIQICGS